MCHISTSCQDFWTGKCVIGVYVTINAQSVVNLTSTGKIFFNLPKNSKL